MTTVTVQHIDTATGDLVEITMPPELHDAIVLGEPWHGRGGLVDVRRFRGAEARGRLAAQAADVRGRSEATTARLAALEREHRIRRDARVDVLARLIDMGLITLEDAEAMHGREPEGDAA